MRALFVRSAFARLICEHVLLSGLGDIDTLPMIRQSSALRKVILRRPNASFYIVMPVRLVSLP